MRIFWIISGVIVAGFAGIMVIGAIVGQPDYPGGLSKVEARGFCEEAIKARSINPATVKFSRPGDRRDVEYVIFTWGREQLQMQNGFGAMLGKSAVCKVNLKTRELVYLDFD